MIKDTHFQSSITIDNSIKPSNTLELNYNSDAWFIRGAISGNGVLEKTGSGQAILTADNSGYTGPVNIEAGQIQVRNSLALGNTSNLVTVSAAECLVPTPKARSIAIQSATTLRSTGRPEVLPADI